MADPPRAQGARRLFIGLPLPLSIGSELAEEVRRVLAPEGAPPRGIRLVAARDLHLTLCFLGTVAGSKVARLAGALEAEVRALPAPDLVVRGAGGFPTLAAPRVLWCGVRDPGPRLASLHEGACRAARTIGWRPSRAERDAPFRPHVTVARVQRGRAPDEERVASFGALGFEAEWRPRGVALVESRPDRPEDRYPVLHEVSLEPAGPGQGSAPPS